MKIDMYAHVFPTKYKEAFYKRLSLTTPGSKSRQHEAEQALWDMDFRRQMVDQYHDLVQVLSVSLPLLEILPSSKDAAEVARIGNDELAEIIAKYPRQFIAGVATLPLTDMDAALNETDRAINELGFKGVLISSNIKGKPLDSPEFMPLYQKMADYDLPIWIHPQSHPAMPGYDLEERSQYGIAEAFGWPYETTVAMARLSCSGVLEKYPDLKFITHHCGGMASFYGQRLNSFNRRTVLAEGGEQLSKAPTDYLRMFYNDTVVNGNTPSLMCSYAFFGVEHLVFGTDVPFGPEHGHMFIRNTIRAVEQMDIPDADKKKIFEDNARKLLHLPLC